MTSQILHAELIKHFSADVQQFAEEQLTAYAGGWPNHLPMAILDAIYSIQTRYTTKHGKALLPRLKTFKETHPQAALHVAKNLTELNPPVYTAQDFNYLNTEHERAYRSVHELMMCLHR